MVCPVISGLVRMQVAWYEAIAETATEIDRRKKTTHQGGFLLDGGMHIIAGIRLLLGPKNTIDRISAFTAQLQKHLSPVDTVDATLKTKHGATGIFSLSFGTTFTGSKWDIAC